MARVTVEDCVDKVTNRFDLVLLAAQRAREISGGAELTLDRDRDKNPVVALREIAEETVLPDDLHDSLIGSLQKVQVDDDDTPDEIGSIAQSAEALRLTAADILVARRLRRLIARTIWRGNEARPAQAGPGLDLFAGPSPLTCQSATASPLVAKSICLPPSAR